MCKARKRVNAPLVGLTNGQNVSFRLGDFRNLRIKKKKASMENEQKTNQTYKKKKKKNTDK